MTNVPLLRKVMEHIEENPEEHDQNHWLRARRRPHLVVSKLEEQRQEIMSCGTAFCFAGHAAFMTGWQPIFGRDSLHFSSENMQKDGERKYVGDIGREELDLTPDQAHMLFRASNTRSYLRALVEQFIRDEEKEA